MKVTEMQIIQNLFSAEKINSYFSIQALRLARNEDTTEKT